MADETERDTRNVVKIVAILVLLALLVAFVVDNTDSVKVGFVVTDRRPPLIIVLIVTALIGALLDRLFQWTRRR
jgi:uncharacterized integral membrane protein